MNLLNVASEDLGAKIKTFSSCLDNLQQPNNILHESQDSLWATGQGLPQFVIVSLEELSVKFKNIIEVGFMLWHDYQTNPKSIQLWVAQTTDQQFVFWSQFILQQKKGIQLYQIKPLPAKYIYLKISITQTYGAFQTYLNRIFFMAEPINPNKIQNKKNTFHNQQQFNKKKQLNIEDLQQNLQKLIQVERKLSQSKSKSKSKKKQKQKILNKNIREESLLVKKQLYPSKNKKVPTKNQISKGSSSSNRGFSIYYHEQENLGIYDSQSHQYVSNEYKSSSSNNNNLSLSKQKNKLRSKKLLSQQSEHFSQSINNITGISPQNHYDSRENISASKSYGQNKQKNAKFHKQQTKKQLNARGKTLVESSGKGKNDKEYAKDVQEQQQQHSSQFQQENQDQQQIEQESNEQQFSNQLIKNTPKYKNYQEQQQQQQNSQPTSQIQNDSNYNYNLAILALSKHVVKMQDNMEDIERKIQVLDMKVSHSHQKIQDSILKKVENKIQEIVDRKLQKVWSYKNIVKDINKNIEELSNKKSTKKTKENQNSQSLQNYKKNLTKQFFKNQYYDGNQQKGYISKDKTKTKRRSIDSQNFGNIKHQNKIQQNNKNQTLNRLKTSKSFVHLKNKQFQKSLRPRQVPPYDEQKKQPNQQYIAQLLQRLNYKLKQRQLKLYKMHKKQKQKQKIQQKSRSKDKKQMNYYRDFNRDNKISYKNELKNFRQIKNYPFRKPNNYYENC